MPSELIEAVEKAEREYESRRRAWNALATPEERRASGIDLSGADAARVAAGAALLEAVGDDHRIEEAAKVYLVLRDGKWALDQINFDGDSFWGYDDGPINDACECAAGLDGDEYDAMRRECDAVRDAAHELRLPDPEELRELLNAHRYERTA